MAKEKMRTVKRLGAGYGLKPRRRLNEIEGGYLGRLQKCSECGAQKVKRIEAGIWKCQKCNRKFASNAYRVI
ncbi:MAG: 50S ribosomal protein L37 [Candidatus Altiarchaeota archaeon]|nr:50S ribosomal protein L37 [Candidatus Altiarchaeota archaeon]